MIWKQTEKKKTIAEEILLSKTLISLGFNFEAEKPSQRVPCLTHPRGAAAGIWVLIHTADHWTRGQGQADMDWQKLGESVHRQK